jgi:hypothetical protein
MADSNRLVDKSNLLTPAEQLEIRTIVDKIAADASIVPRSLRGPASAAALPTPLRPAAPVAVLRSSDSETSMVELRWSMPATEAAVCIEHGVSWILYRSEYDRETRARVKGTTKTACRTSGLETTWIDRVVPGRGFGYTVVCSIVGRGTSPPSLITLVDA